MLSFPVIVGILCFSVDFFTVIVVEICDTFLPSYLGAMQLIIYLFLFTVGVTSYYKAIKSNPGYIPRMWKPSHRLHRHRRINYCRKCQSTQVPRAFHCPTCSKCVLRMDHHSFWVNNCIGAGNQKSYLLLLFYTLILSLYTIGTGIFALLSIINSLNDSTQRARESVWLAVKLSLVILSFTYSFVWVVVILPAIPRSFSSLIHNQTRIEILEQGSFSDVNTPQPHYHNPYDTGSWVLNVKSVMGRNPLLWILPVSPGVSLNPEDWLEGDPTIHHHRYPETYRLGDDPDIESTDTNLPSATLPDEQNENVDDGDSEVLVAQTNLELSGSKRTTSPHQQIG